MRDSLRKRLIRVASNLSQFRLYKEFYEEMASFSDKLNSSASVMAKALQDRDVDSLSKSLVENKKTAAELSFVLQRHQRILFKLESEA